MPAGPPKPDSLIHPASNWSQPPDPSTLIIPDKPNSSPASLFIASVLYFLANLFGATLAWIALLIAGLAVAMVAVILSSGTIAILGAIFISAVALPLALVAAAGAFRLLSERLQEIKIGPWQARLVLITIYLVYSLLLTLLVLIIIFLVATLGAKYGLALGGLGLTVLLISGALLPGFISSKICNAPQGLAKGLSVAALVVAGLGAASFSALNFIASDGSQGGQTGPDQSQRLANQQQEIRGQLDGASQASQTFLIDQDIFKTRRLLAQYLCRADYKIHGQDSRCVFSTVDVIPENRVKSNPNQIFVGNISKQTIELCGVGGKRVFCTLVSRNRIWRGWSSFSFESARAAAEENLGWPKDKLSQKQSELEKTINDIIGQIEN